jgi:hypothetical protein
MTWNGNGITPACQLFLDKFSIQGNNDKGTANSLLKKE